MTIAGLAALAASFNLLFEIIKRAGAAYLFYLAWALFTSKLKVSETNLPMEGRGITVVLSGLSISIGNLKNMLLCLTLMPSLIDMQVVAAMGWLQLVATPLIMLVAVDLS
ncbi:LysE family transporter [Microvirga sp. KLBC 81]|uniref:LysE family transporter n=1 Tax=Microvirga sp. KLBC 81 TaxID=1862707 RepID=UPI001402C0A4|nr:LysE family transporter [Microvirga sp. KLBC 81]